MVLILVLVLVGLVLVLVLFLACPILVKSTDIFTNTLKTVRILCFFVGLVKIERKMRVFFCDVVYNSTGGVV